MASNSKTANASWAFEKENKELTRLLQTPQQLESTTDAT